MSTIDRQRVAAVRALQRMGYTWDGEWKAPAGAGAAPTAQPDDHVSRMVALIKLTRKFYFTDPQSRTPNVCDDGGPAWHLGSHFEMESRDLLGPKS